MAQERRPTLVIPAPLRLLPFVLPLYATTIVVFSLRGEITTFQTVAALFAPLAAWLLALHPSWFVCGILAIPAGAIDLIPLGRPELLAGLLLAALMYRLLTDRGIALPIALLPFALLVVLAATIDADVTVAADAVSHRLLRLFAFYLVLGGASFALARAGELSVVMVSRAILVGVIGTIVLLLFQVSSPESLLLSSGSAPPDPGLLGYRTHFGYLMAIGCACSLPYAARSTRSGGSLAWWGLALVTAAMAGLSFTRGAWASVLLVTAFVFLATRRMAGLVVAAAAISLLLTVPSVSERLTGGSRGDSLSTVGAAEFTTGRTELWGALADRAALGLPWGNGWGYTWSLTAPRLLGPARTFGDGDFLYPHNDFLFWSLELGIPGLALFVLLWAALVGAARRARNVLLSWEWQVLVGVGVSMFVASAVDNGIFIRAISEPFFVCAGLLSAGVAARR